MIARKAEAPLAALQMANTLTIASPGTATFLFTDIESSTEKWEEDPDRMARATAAHDGLLRAAIEEHHGRVVKTMGDGMVAVFADAVDGVAAALAFQIALADLMTTSGMRLAVRCGLHAGAAQQRDDDFFGPTLNRAARVMGLASGGQVLLSQAVVDMVSDGLPQEVGLRDLGEVRLKGLAGTERVHQLLHPRLREAFPALRVLEATPNNLPHQLTSFIGREREIADAKGLLERSRLLTLCGIGGLGKTRLALQIASDMLDDYRDGAWFVDLAPIREGKVVPGAAATVFGVREDAGSSVEQTLCAHLRTRELLLILDNCEHLLHASADLAKAILHAAPNVRILATSREPLHVPGEQMYTVAPLPVPDRDAGLQALSRSTAVRLFVERVQQNKPSFVLDERGAPAVADLVARVEGIPLALELAAARVGSLSVQDINKRLDDRFKLLTGGSHVLLERQQTLRALVDWSYDLLSEGERILLMRLSSFAGGFDLSAAEAVCGTKPLAPDDIVDLLAALVDKSLVLASDVDETIRYGMLETIRDYARLKLIESGYLNDTLLRHCNHYFLTAKAAGHGMGGPEHAKSVARLETDHDNVRAAIAFAMGGFGDPIVAVKMEVALQGFRVLQGYAGEGRSNIRGLLALPAIATYDVAHAHALYVGAALADSQGDEREAERMLESCLALRRVLGKEVDVAATLSTLAAVRLRLGDAARARVGEEEALALFQKIGDRTGEAIALLHIGEVCAYVGDHAKAHRFLSHSIALAREMGYSEAESDSERMLAQLALERGDLAEATEHIARSLAICQDAQNKRGTAIASWWQGKIELAAGNTGSAQPHLHDALKAFRSFGMSVETIGALEDHARLAYSLALSQHAARLYGAASAARERLMLPRSPRSQALWLDELAAVRATLTEPAFAAGIAEGQEMDVAEAINRALLVSSGPSTIPRESDQPPCHRS